MTYRCLIALLLTSTTIAAQSGLSYCFDFDSGLLPSVNSEIVYDNNGGLGEGQAMTLSGSGTLLLDSTGSFGRASYMGGVLGGPLTTPLVATASMRTVIQARLRVDSVSNNGIALQLIDGSFGYTILFVPTGLSIRTASGNIVVPVVHSTMRTYRIESPGGSGVMNVSVDGTLIWSGFAPSNTLNGLSFGDGHSPSNNWASSEWEYVFFQNGDDFTSHDHGTHEDLLFTLGALTVTDPDQAFKRVAAGAQLSASYGLGGTTALPGFLAAQSYAPGAAPLPALGLPEVGLSLEACILPLMVGPLPGGTLSFGIVPTSIIGMRVRMQLFAFDVGAANGDGRSSCVQDIEIVL